MCEYRINYFENIANNINYDFKNIIVTKKTKLMTNHDKKNH